MVLPLLKSDLYKIMMACVEGKLDTVDLETEKDKSAVGVVLVSDGYPGSYKKGFEITGQLI